MCVKLYSLVYQKHVKGIAKTILLHMAIRAEPDGSNVFEAQESIADHLDLDRVTVFRAQKKLEERGLIAKTGEKKGRANVYRLNVDAIGLLPTIDKKLRAERKRCTKQHVAERNSNGCTKQHISVAESNTIIPRKGPLQSGSAMKRTDLTLAQYARGEMDERLATDPGYQAFLEEMEARAAKERELADFHEAKTRRGYRQ